jgi:hypothetical protein
MVQGGPPIARMTIISRSRPASPRTSRDPSPHLNCGIAGTEMRGGGGGAILEALPMPLGSTVALFIPPTFAGPGGIPLMGTFPIPASPAILANEAAGARKTSNARAIFTEVLDMTSLYDWSVPGGDVSPFMRRRH